MPLHLFAYYENLAANAFKEVTVVRDDVLTRTSDTRFMIPAGLHNVYFGFVGGATLGDAYIFTPSLETKKFRCRLIPKKVGDTVIDKYNPEVWVPDPPIRLMDTEELSLYAQNTSTSATSATVGVFALGLDTLPPIPAGERILVKATGTTTLTAYTWTTVRVIPEVQLEAGTYALIGFIPISDGCIAARVIIPGQVWRPGVIGIAGTEPSALDFENKLFDKYPKYEMGRFSHITIPEFQFLSKTADTSEVVYMYLVKVA
jgi:hypothetical protein